MCSQSRATGSALSDPWMHQDNLLDERPSAVCSNRADSIAIVHVPGTIFGLCVFFLSRHMKVAHPDSSDDHETLKRAAKAQAASIARDKKRRAALQAIAKQQIAQDEAEEARRKAEEDRRKAQEEGGQDGGEGSGGEGSGGEGSGGEDGGEGSGGEDGGEGSGGEDGGEGSGGEEQEGTGQELQVVDEVPGEEEIPGTPQRGRGRKRYVAIVQITLQSSTMRDLRLFLNCTLQGQKSNFVIAAIVFRPSDEKGDFTRHQTVTRQCQDPYLEPVRFT